MLIVLISLLEAAICLFLMYYSIAGKQQAVRSYLLSLESELEEKKEIKENFLKTFGSMIDVGTLRVKVNELKSAEASLRAEKGRITITQAELDTVEARLRELEEIERELEASGLETKEELSILQKKTDDLRQRKDKLEGRLQDAAGKIDQLVQELELTSQMQEHLENMKAQLLQTQSKIDLLLLQIEEGNSQYFSVKRRYDALDIEYAQLYEKFAEAEALLED